MVRWLLIVGTRATIAGRREFPGHPHQKLAHVAKFEHATDQADRAAHVAKYSPQDRGPPLPRWRRRLEACSHRSRRGAQRYDLAGCATGFPKYPPCSSFVIPVQSLALIWDRDGPPMTILTVSKWARYIWVGDGAFSIRSAGTP